MTCVLVGQERSLRPAMAKTNKFIDTVSREGTKKRKRKRKCNNRFSFFARHSVGNIVAG